MTVAKLKQTLSKYPDYMEVRVASGPVISSIDEIKPVIDIDTNIMSVIMCGSRLNIGWHEEKNK
mgnify:CR=1 FL=1